MSSEQDNRGAFPIQEHAAWMNGGATAQPPTDLPAKAQIEIFGAPT